MERIPITLKKMFSIFNFWINNKQTSFSFWVQEKWAKFICLKKNYFTLQKMQKNITLKNIVCVSVSVYGNDSLVCKKLKIVHRANELFMELLYVLFSSFIERNFIWISISSTLLFTLSCTLFYLYAKNLVQL